MSGILFLKTQKLEALKEFYTVELGCRVWLDQKDCVIFRHGNFLFGFCDRDETETSAMLTFFYDTPEQVDRMYRILKPTATSKPVHNDRYSIYQFFARDPEGRMVECQYFENPVRQYLAGDDLLLTRRSVRHFTPEPVTDEALRQVLDLARYAPTARNTQSYYFKIICDRETIEWLSKVRDKSTSPISRAPMAVAICADPALSKRYVQDGCIGAYHFLLAAWFHGLGTCWIAAMDREDVKERLGIPAEHYVATVTPLGHPEHRDIKVPDRKEIGHFVKE